MSVVTTDQDEMLVEFNAMLYELAINERRKARIITQKFPENLAALRRRMVLEAGIQAWEENRNA